MSLLLVPLAPSARELASAPQTLQVGVLHIPPLAIVNSPQETKGPLVEYIQRLLQTAGIPYRIEGFPARRLYRNLGVGKSQFWIGVKNVAEYEGKVLYSEQPVYKLHLQMYRLPGTPELAQLTKLQNQRLIVIQGYSYGGQLESLKRRPQGLQLETACDNRKAMEILQLRRGEYLLSYAEPIEDTLKQQAKRPIFLQTPLEPLPMYLVLNHAVPEAEHLMRRLNHAAELLRQSGETARIFAQRAE